MYVTSHVLLFHPHKVTECWFARDDELCVDVPVPDSVL